MHVGGVGFGVGFGVVIGATVTTGGAIVGKTGGDQQSKYYILTEVSG